MQYAIIRMTDYGAPDRIFVADDLAAAHAIAEADAKAIGQPLSLITAYPGGDQGGNTPEMPGAHWIMPISEPADEQSAAEY